MSLWLFLVTLKKAETAKLAPCRHIQNVEGKLGNQVEQVPPLDDCVALYVANQQYMIDHGLRKDFLPSCDAPVNACGVLQNIPSLQNQCRSLFGICI